jgi:hypothetical protein
VPVGVDQGRQVPHSVLRRRNADASGRNWPN